MAKNDSNPRKNAIQDRAKVTFEAIIEATSQLLQDKGLSTLSTNKIVERAGVSVGSLYQYFPNKDSIINVLREKSFNKQTEEMIKLIESVDLTSLSLKDGIAKVVASYFQYVNNRSHFFTQLLSSFVTLDNFKFMTKNDEKTIEVLTKKLKVFENEINSEDLGKKLAILLYALKGIQIGKLFSLQGISTEEISKEAADLIYKYLKKDI